MYHFFIIKFELKVGLDQKQDKSHGLVFFTCFSIKYKQLKHAKNKHNCDLIIT